MTDQEIRMFCLKLTMSSDTEFTPQQFPDIEKAKELYDFICPSASTPEALRKLPRVPFRLRVKHFLSLFRLRR